jgi:hypothetical protein
LAGLAAELSRVQPEAPAPKPRPQPREREAARARAPQPERERVRPVPPPPAAMDEPTTAANADQNLAEMAQRLEAALRRPKSAESRGSDSGAKPVMMAPPAPEPMIPMADPVPFPSAETTAARDEPPAAPQQAAPAARPAAAAKPQKSVYDSLEQEMASLLGRPNSKA